MSNEVLWLVMQEGRPLSEYAVALGTQEEADQAVEDFSKDGNRYEVWRAERMPSETENG